MAIRNLRFEEDPILRKKSKEVKKFDERLVELLDDMKDTMIEKNGIGLAAVQVGTLKRIFIADLGEENIVEFINPVILKSSGEQIGSEGCLSVPDASDYVNRPTYVKIKATDRNGVDFELEVENFEAVIICHEYDHLDGILYVDKTVPKPENFEEDEYYDDEDEDYEEEE